MLEYETDRRTLQTIYDDYKKITKENHLYHPSNSAPTYLVEFHCEPI